jgi:mono/diheme cytochrome c family protein
MRPTTALVLGMIVFEVVIPASGRCQPGAVVFQARCARCHGDTGKADTSVARALKVAPLVSDAKLARMTPAEIVNLVKSNPKHRGVVHLREADLKAAAFFAKKLAKQCEP